MAGTYVTVTGHLEELGNKAATELERILSFWSSVAVDRKNGGFYGEVDGKGIPVPGAAKGAVLNMRILWTFSAAALTSKNMLYRKMADRAYKYVRDHFIDRASGGLFWTVDAEGNPQDTRKQIYALAFGIYALSAYARLAGEDAGVMEMCLELFDWIEHVSFDSEYNGYYEAFDRNGHRLKDVRLSEKDLNEPKTMNTHLHLLEAYTSLYRILHTPRLERQLRNLLQLFLNTILEKDTGHLQLFFRSRGSWGQHGSLSVMTSRLHGCLWRLRRYWEIQLSWSRLPDAHLLSLTRRRRGCRRTAVSFMSMTGLLVNTMKSGSVGKCRSGCGIPECLSTE
jgi:mannose/cellobiose epimerase-like protein (N-acyl-D-glucosamine 2-epimerase family)